jgi:hypothetical protein
MLCYNQHIEHGFVVGFLNDDHHISRSQSVSYVKDQVLIHLLEIYLGQKAQDL